MINHLRLPTPRGVLVINKILLSSMYSHEKIKGILTDQTTIQVEKNLIKNENLFTGETICYL